jgi:fructokinase
MTKPLLMVGLGEVLWDILPSARVLGGAPTNFAYMTSVLGNRGVVASRVGQDSLGKEACDVMENLGLTTTYIQRDEDHETGSAGVQLDSAGLPTFTIKESVAWDFLDWTPAWEELSAKADVVCFGSLAQRSATTADTIDRFLHNTRKEALKIFDVNLRQSFYSIDVLHKLFRQADIVKLTDQEMRRVGSLLSSDDTEEEELAHWLRTEFGLKLVCITRGERGSILVSEQEVIEHPGLGVEVVDTVGAGDAFTACLADKFVQGHPLTEISDAANRLASWVVTQRGAMPKIDPARLQKILGGAEQTAFYEGIQ